jgi:uncharacterized protein
MFMQLFIIPFFAIWRCAGLMLVGMALMKWGVFSGSRSTSFYVKCIAWGMGLGLPIVALGVWDMHRSGFDILRSFYGFQSLNYVGSLGMSLAYVAIVVLLTRSANSIITRIFAPMGRMAFTNYLTQTLICTTVFYGYGLGYYGSIPRWQLFFVFVPVVLIVQAFVSSLWLRHFRMGPAEWLWRALTYMTRPAMREPATTNL